MLKWLVTRGPSFPPDREVLTDDPLATLRVKPKGSRNTAEEIYAVSRVNPIYEDEELEISAGQQKQSGTLDDNDAVITRRLSIEKNGDPESSNEDRTSVRSSGYGSKENDSVSNRSDPHDDELSGHESGDGGHTTPPPVPVAFSDVHRKTHQGEVLVHGPNILRQDARFVTYIRDGDTPDSLSLQRLKSISSGNLVNGSDFLQQNTLPLPASVKRNHSTSTVHQRQIRTLERIPRAQLQGSLTKGDIGIIKQNWLSGAAIVNHDRNYVSSISNIEEEGDLTSRSEKQCFKTVAELRKSFEDVYKRSNQNIDISRNPDFVHSIDVGMRRARSLETLSPRNQHARQHESGTSTIPRPIWPKVSKLAESLEKEAFARDQKKRLDTSINGNGLLVSVPTSTVPNINVLNSNSNYVTSVNVGPQHHISRAKSFSEGFNEAQQDVTQITYEGHDWPKENEADYASVAKYFGGERNGINFPLMSLQPDSLVTEDTLQMMRYGGANLELDHQDDTHIDDQIENTDNESESNDIPNVNRVMYTRGLYATLNRAASLQTKDFRKAPVKSHRSKSIAISLPNRKTSAKKRGVNAVKDLWEKSGLKTNGRKLVIDVQDILGEDYIHDSVSRQGSNSSEEPIIVHSQPRNLKSALVRNPKRFTRLESDTTNTSSRSVNTYEDISSLDRGYTSQVSMGTTESKSCATYEEVPNECYNGFDNAAFLDDDERTFSKDNGEAITHFPTRPKYLNPSQLEEFQKKINAKLQSAPLHRLQWLDLDEIHVEETVDKQERRVTFTENTYIPCSLERNTGCRVSPKTLQRCPGTPIRINHPGTPNLRRHSEVMLNPGDLPHNASISRNGSLNRNGTHEKNSSMARNGNMPKPQYVNGRWEMSENYQSRYQDSPTSNLISDKQHGPQECCYGTSNTDPTLPQVLAPLQNCVSLCHDNCPYESICHDFTLDMRRSEKMMRQSQAQKRRRKCYAAILILMAVSLFIIVCIAISIFYSDGKNWFGSS
ncbi:unnamed protein product [Meganyctiphanes norvegica]|uniref:Uncharacterized protein n=1 Tax=Meganyctiphanes norvegica TaxID=48144 RepID=A0AAV2Q3W1_MEGNR